MSCIGASCEIHDDLRSAGVANALQPKANCSRNIGRYTRIARNHSAPASLTFGDHRAPRTRELRPAPCDLQPAPATYDLRPTTYDLPPQWQPAPCALRRIVAANRVNMPMQLQIIAASRGHVDNEYLVDYSDILKTV